MKNKTSLVDSIRAASREMVRELGFMESTLASTSYSPSAVHTLMEVAAQGAMTSAQLVGFLGLDKSSVSRMVGKLVAWGEVAEEAASDDGRAKQLSLTAKGRRTVEKIHAFGQMQVVNSLSHMNPSQQQAVAQGLAAYADGLKAHRLGTGLSKQNAPEIRTGYQPGLVGRVAEMHATFYSAHSSFGQFFESKVASGVAEFAGRLSEPCNRVWTANLNGRIVGSLAVDGDDLGDNMAHLRWFILDDGCRGSGVGRQMMAEAMNFCDIRGFAETHLWTFKGLDAARKLYESCGFQLVHEEEGSNWGTPVTEQQFVRVASSA